MKSAFIILPIIFLTNFVCYSQTFNNLDFEQICDTSKTGFCNWNLSWGGKDGKIKGQSGTNKFLLLTGSKENSVNFVEQSVFLNSNPGLHLIELSGEIFSENIIGKGAGFNIALYDSQGNYITGKDMGYSNFSWVYGTNESKKYIVRLISPEHTYKVNIGCIMYGKGTAGFDNLSVKISSVEGREPSKLAIDYVSAACDTIAKYSVMKDSVDFIKLKQIALKIAGDAENYSECHLAIEYMLTSLGEHHSFFMKPDEVSNWKNDKSEFSTVKFPSSKVVNSCGYIFVPPFHAGNKKLIMKYADSMQVILKELNNSDIKGWIIDLRENTGGNMEPMILGLGPIFDSEKLGSLNYIDGKSQSWYYKNGSYQWDDDKISEIVNPVKLKSKLPIAVLIGPQTGSSGEIVAISFIGNGKTKFFGEPTWGLTTGNSSFDLPDGGRMMLASTFMADRNGNVYYGKVQPDEIIPASKDKSNDSVLERAIDWIQKFN
jgi:C-terminal processing protease CtpA/Prc